MSEIIQYLSFSVCHTSFSIIPSWSMHVVANGKILFFFFYGWVMLHCVYIPHIVFIHLFADGCLGCFHILAIVNNVTIFIIQVSMGLQIYFWIVFLFSLDKHPGVQLLDRVVVLFLIFWGISILFSIVSAPICIPTNNA